MTVENTPVTQASPRTWQRRLLYYVIAALLVTVTLQIGSPEKLCSLADGITESVSKVDPFYATKEAYAGYQRGNRLFLNHAAAYGGGASTNPYPHGLGLVLASVWRALRNTVAADWATLLISLLALLLSVVALVRFKPDEIHPLYFLLALPLSGLIAFVLKYLLLIAAYPFGCSGRLMVLVVAVWPIIKAAWDIREMAGRVENADRRLRR